METAVYEYERLWVTPMSIRRAQLNERHGGGDGPMNRQNVVRSKRNRVYGSIIEIKDTDAYIRFDEKLSKFTARTHVDQAAEFYFIRFMNNRTGFMLEHQALQKLSDDEPFKFVFPNASEMHELETAFKSMNLQPECVSH